MNRSLRVGDIEVFSISDGRLAGNPTASFPTSESGEWDKFRSLYPDAFTPDGGWYNNLGLFCLRTPDSTIIVDTGIGPGPVESLGGVRGVLPRALDRIGVDPAEVDLVFFTHLHRDHIGWTAVGRGEDDLFFANAEHIVHEADWAYFAAPASGDPSQAIVDSILPLEKGGQLRLLHGGGSSLASGLEVFHTPGHTPGHMSVLARSGDSELFISGDLIHHPAQVERTGWSHRADVDGQESGVYRDIWLDRMEERGGFWATGHFPPPSIGGLVRSGGVRIWQPMSDASLQPRKGDVTA